MPNYYDMTAGDQQAASAGIPPAQTTGTTGATTTAAQAESDVQRLHKYKLPPPYFNGDYSNYDEWRLKLQTYLGLLDNEFDQILRAADVATNTVVDQHLINEVLPDTARGNALVNLARDLHYILISICQAAPTGQTKLLHSQRLRNTTTLNNRFSLPVGTRSVGYLTKLLKPSFSEQHERGNGAALLVEKRLQYLQQHLQLRAGTMTTYTAVRDVVVEYYKTISAFSKMNAATSSAVGSNYGGGPAAKDVDNLWKKGSYKGRHTGGKNLQETSQHLQSFPTNESNTYYATFKEPSATSSYYNQPPHSTDTNNCLGLEIYVDADWAGCPTARK